MLQTITPIWPASTRIKACTTTRHGGFSTGEYASFNLGENTEEDFTIITRNRAFLHEELKLPTEPVWLKQVHGTVVIQADQSPASPILADAAYTREKNIVCTVTTADCLPLLICDKQATCVAAVHAGWKGLAAGVIEATLDAIKIPGEELLVWLGPAIGPRAFEVKEDVLKQFVDMDPQAMQAFKPISSDHWLANIYLLAHQRLAKYNVTAIYGGDHCTYTEKELFYSFRRDNKTGRMASLIWLQDPENKHRRIF